MGERIDFKNPEIIYSLLDYYDSIFKICLGFTKNPWDAEDLMHEVYIRALEKIDSLRDHKQSKIWLFRIARNTCLNFVNKQRLHRIISPEPRNPGYDSNSPEWQMMQSEHFQLLKKTVSKLPKKQREVFILREYGHLSYKEISDVLNVNEGTVMSRLNRARQAVKSQIKEVNNEN